MGSPRGRLQRTGLRVGADLVATATERQRRDQRSRPRCRHLRDHDPVLLRQRPILGLAGRTERAVEANLTTPCVRNARALLLVALIYLEPFALRALGAVREDELLVEQAAERFAATVFRVIPACEGDSGLEPEPAFAGTRRHACTQSRRLITRRSQVQIRPPLLRKAPHMRAFCPRSAASIPRVLGFA
jgi:hypothetical protein